MLIFFLQYFLWHGTQNSRFNGFLSVIVSRQILQRCFEGETLETVNITRFHAKPDRPSNSKQSIKKPTTHTMTGPGADRGPGRGPTSRTAPPSLTTPGTPRRAAPRHWPAAGSRLAPAAPFSHAPAPPPVVHRASPHDPSLAYSPCAVPAAVCQVLPEGTAILCGRPLVGRNGLCAGGSVPHSVSDSLSKDAGRAG